jgi:Tfp pilus assembly protein PilF
MRITPLLVTCLTLYTLTTSAQQLTLDQWNEQAKTNIRLLPKYGYAIKTDDQKKADQEFIAAALKQDTTNRKASNHLIRLGFQYLYTDITKAMYRFNQAWLLDSTNSDIYWGYGGVYMALGDFPSARAQYTAGLAANANNTHLLTDLGTYYLVQYYTQQPLDQKKARTQLDSAINYMTRSYKIDSKDQNTTFKLAVCYLQKKDCQKAWRYYNECVSVGGQPITADFTKALKEQCPATNQ